MPTSGDVQALTNAAQELLFLTPDNLLWAPRMRNFLRQWSNPDTHRAMEGDPNAANFVFGFLNAQLTNYPDQMNVIMTELGLELPDGGEGSEQQSYLDALSGLPSGLVGNIVETINQTTRETTERTRTVEEQIESSADILNIRHETRFIDIPTAEEFLDNFETAIVTQADTLRRAGQIDTNTARFMSNNFDVFLDAYIADLGRRIQAGEDIFKVVGLDQGPVLVGSRPGEAVREETTSTLEEIRTGTTTIEDVIERTIERLTGESGTQDGGAVDRTLVQNITEAVNSIFTEALQGRTVEEQVRSLVSYTIEDVMTRPNLTAVFAFSPTQFLTERYSPTELMNIAAAVPGQEAAARQTPFGLAPSAPRRLQ